MEPLLKRVSGGIYWKRRHGIDEVIFRFSQLDLVPNLLNIYIYYIIIIIPIPSGYLTVRDGFAEPFIDDVPNLKMLDLSMAKRLGLAESIWEVPTTWGIYRELRNFRSVVCRTHIYIYTYTYIYIEIDVIFIDHSLFGWIKTHLELPYVAGMKIYLLAIFRSLPESVP